MRRFLPVLLLLLLTGCGRGSRTPVPAPTAERGNWKALSKGMPPDQVRTILGKPLREETQGEVTCWYYQKSPPLQRYTEDDNRWMVPRGAVLFSAEPAGNLGLSEWREP